MIALVLAAFGSDSALDEAMHRARLAVGCLGPVGDQRLLLQVGDGFGEVRIDGEREETGPEAKRCLDAVFQGLPFESPAHRLGLSLVREGGDWTLDVACAGSGDLTEGVAALRALRPHVEGCTSLFAETGSGAVELSLEGEASLVGRERLAACVLHPFREQQLPLTRAVYPYSHESGRRSLALDQVSGWSGLSWGAPPSPDMHRVDDKSGQRSVYERRTDRRQRARSRAAPTRVFFNGYPVSSLTYHFWRGRLYKVSFTAFEPGVADGILASLRQSFGDPTPRGSGFRRRMGWDEGEISLEFHPDDPFPDFSYVHRDLEAKARRAGGELE